MNIPFITLSRRLLFVLALGSAGALASSCSDKTEVVAKDYSAIDEELIKKYLTDNGITNAQRQPSGLYFVPVTTDANSVAATAGRTVSVLYTGRLLNGTVFDATSQRGNTPFSFVLGRGEVITGWDQGIALMRRGEKAILLIPSALGYGARGAGSSIPPNAVLRFDVELTSVN